VFILGSPKAGTTDLYWFVLAGIRRLAVQIKASNRKRRFDATRKRRFDEKDDSMKTIEKKLFDRNLRAGATVGR